MLIIWHYEGNYQKMQFKKLKLGQVGKISIGVLFIKYVF